MVLDNGAYFDSHALTNSDMVLEDGALSLSEDKWELVRDVQLNVFYDDGTCYVDLGMDRAYNEEGYWVVGSNNDGELTLDHPNGKLPVVFDGTWMTINGEVVPYYYVGTVEDNGHEVVTGYVPALLNSAELNNEKVYVMVVCEDGGDYYIAGARYIYQDNGGETDTLAKGLIELNNGDKLTFICDCYSYAGEYQATYEMFDMVYDSSDCEIGYMEFDYSKVLVTYCLTDIYNNEFWTESVEF